MLTDEEVRALVRARAECWVERKLRNQNRYVRRMRRIDPKFHTRFRPFPDLAILVALRAF